MADKNGKHKEDQKKAVWKYTPLGQQMKYIRPELCEDTESAIFQIFLRKGQELNTKRLMVYGRATELFNKGLINSPKVPLNQIIFVHNCYGDLRNHLKSMRYMETSNPRSELLLAYTNEGHVARPDYYIRDTDMVIMFDV